MAVHMTCEACGETYVAGLSFAAFGHVCADPPPYESMVAVAARHGYTIDAYNECAIQGVQIGYSRPKRDGESVLGLPVAGDRVESEVIERHYCPEVVASEAVQDVTARRAMQRVIWEIEAEQA